jgi:hypothetical protein
MSTPQPVPVQFRVILEGEHDIDGNTYDPPIELLMIVTTVGETTRFPEAPAREAVLSPKADLVIAGHVVSSVRIEPLEPDSPAGLESEEEK